MSVALEPRTWAENQFGSCELGDVRRVRRLVKFSAQIAADPDGSTPDQAERWSDLKAAYRLIGNEAVTFEAITSPHREMARAREGGIWLISNDTTEINFGVTNEATGLGPLGTGLGRGFLLHSGLMIAAETEDVIGLAGQEIHYRKPVPKGETRAQRLARYRESQMWCDLIDQVGKPPAGTQFVDLCDRAADNFEVFCHCLLNNHDWIIRAQHLHRKIRHKGDEIALGEFLDKLPVAGQYDLTYRGREYGTRTAQIEVRFGSLMVPIPRHSSEWVRGSGITRVEMNVVEVREINAPKGVQPLRWVLLTSLPVTTFSEAWQIIEYYEKRPIVEEFHKALKTGCRVQERQYEDSDRLEAITGLLSVAAVRLLQLRGEAYQSPDVPAEEVVPIRWVTVLRTLRSGRRIRTVRQFYRELAGLGGHLLRKSDGEPGWITLWRGFEKLHLAVRGVRAYLKRCG